MVIFLWFGRSLTNILQRRLLCNRHVDGQDDSRSWDSLMRNCWWRTICRVGFILLATTNFMDQMSWCDLILGGKLAFEFQISILMPFYLAWWRVSSTSYDGSQLLGDSRIKLSCWMIVFNVCLNWRCSLVSNGWTEIWFVTEAQGSLPRWSFESRKWGLVGSGSRFCFSGKYWLVNPFISMTIALPFFSPLIGGLKRFEPILNLSNPVWEVLVGGSAFPRTKPVWRGLGSAKRCPNLDQTGPWPV